MKPIVVTKIMEVIMEKNLNYNLLLNDKESFSQQRLLNNTKNPKK